MTEAGYRLLAFAVSLLVLLVWEWRAAARSRDVPRRVRWSGNFGLGVLDALLVRIVFPAGAVGAAVLASRHSVGLLNQWPAHRGAAIAASVLVLDLVIYLQHRLFHIAPVLWRVHRVHHADPELDVSTALRFHPIESLLSMLLKAVVVVTLGLPAAGVLVFEVLLNSAAMFNHSNALLARGAEPVLRRILVTPEMHRVHHSTVAAQANTNFGFSVSWWDRLFGTYAAPAPDCNAPIGLPDGAADAAHVRLGSMLVMPFRSPAARGAVAQAVDNAPKS